MWPAPQVRHRQPRGRSTIIPGFINFIAPNIPQGKLRLCTLYQREAVDDDIITHYSPEPVSETHLSVRQQPNSRLYRAPREDMFNMGDL